MTLTRPTSAIARLAARYYNENAVSAGNPGGLDESDDGLTAGHVTNFPAALVDFGVVAGYVGDAADTVFVAQSTLALVWDSGTADANPGVGKVRASTAALTSGGYTLFVSTTDALGGDATAVLADYGASTSAIKGRLRLVKIGASAVYIDVNVTGVEAASGYRKIAVTYLAGPGGFAAGDAVAVGFVRSGDTARWLSGAGAPSNAVGNDGDQYVNVSSGAAYAKTGGLWSATGANLLGPSGNNKISDGGTAGGTANALTCTAVPGPTLAQGQAISLKTGASANTGAATLNPNGLGASAIQKNGAALGAGDLPASTRVLLVYDGTYWQLQATGRAAATAADVAAGTSALLDVTPAALSGMIPLLSGPSGGLVYNDLLLIYDVSASAPRAVAVSALATATQPSTSTWDPGAKASNITLTNSNLVATESTTNGIGCVLSTVGKSSGKWYCEIIILSGIDFFLGVATASHPLTTRLGQTAFSWAIYSNGKIQSNQAGDPTVSYGLSFTTGDRIGIAFDMATGRLWFRKNGVWMGSGDPVAGTNPAFSNLTGTIYIAITGTGTGNPSYQYVPSLANWADMSPTGFLQF